MNIYTFFEACCFAIDQADPDASDGLFDSMDLHMKSGAVLTSTLHDINCFTNCHTCDDYNKMYKSGGVAELAQSPYVIFSGKNIFLSIEDIEYVQILNHDKES